jgi:pimeloyl-ACP methyl ester carboxylesterase
MAVVLLHGFTQTRQSWRRTIAAGRYRAIAPDLPGHGQAGERLASFPACAAYVRALADGPCTLVGY